MPLTGWCSLHQGNGDSAASELRGLSAGRPFLAHCSAAHQATNSYFLRYMLHLAVGTTRAALPTPSSLACPSTFHLGQPRLGTSACTSDKPMCMWAASLSTGKAPDHQTLHTSDAHTLPGWCVCPASILLPAPALLTASWPARTCRRRRRSPRTRTLTRTRTRRRPRSASAPTATTVSPFGDVLWGCPACLLWHGEGLRVQGVPTWMCAPGLAGMQALPALGLHPSTSFRCCPALPPLRL